MHLVLQLGSIHLNGDELQYQGQPMDKRGTVTSKEEPLLFLYNLRQPLQSNMYLKYEYINFD